MLFHKGKCIIVDIIFKEIIISHFMEEGLCVNAFSPISSTNLILPVHTH